MSTATIHGDRRDAPNDEASGLLGGHEPGVPDHWEHSVRIARCWAAAQMEAAVQGTRRVALRSAMALSPVRGDVFDVLLRLARVGLGGPVAGSGQYVSRIHDHDLVGATELLPDRDDLMSGRAPPLRCGSRCHLTSPPQPSATTTRSGEHPPGLRWVRPEKCEAADAGRGRRRSWNMRLPEWADNPFAILCGAIVGFSAIAVVIMVVATMVWHDRSE
jgi:hypothetical protein